MGTQRVIQINIPEFLPLCTSYIEISVHTSGKWAVYYSVNGYSDVNCRGLSLGCYNGSDLDNGIAFQCVLVP
jgi:hypothetical protein